MGCTTLVEIDNHMLDGLVFCASAYELFEHVRSTEDGRSRLRMRASDTEKKLVEELLPICKYVQTKYRAGRYISIKWINGSQQHDAEYQQTGGYVDIGHYPASGYLEVTCVMHPNDYLMRELLENGGVGFSVETTHRDKKTRVIESVPKVSTNHDFIDSYSPLVIEQLKKKAGKDYPQDTTLIVQCSLNRLYMPDEWEVLVAQVRAGLPEHRFREVFMYDAVSEQTASL